MNSRLTKIHEHRRELVARVAAQRAELAVLVYRLERPLSILDRGLAAIRTMRQHPVLVAGAVTAVVALRGRGVLKWGRRLWAGWQVYRTLRGRINQHRL